MIYNSSARNALSPLVCRSISRAFESKASVEAAPTGCPHQPSSDEVDWKDARPFKDIPGPTRFQLITGFLPGGPYYKKSITIFFEDLRKKYGNFIALPGMFGKETVVMSLDPDIFRKVFRNEGIWPTRMNFDSPVYFRKVYKKDYFRGVEGIVMTSGESWGNFRTAVNPVLMNPKNARQYLTKMLPVNKEFLQRIREIRDPDTLEMPDTFVDEISRLAFESVAAIALDQELGLIRRNRDIPEAELLFSCLKEFSELVYELDVQPSIWKIIKTPKFYRMMKVCDNMFTITSKFIEDSLEKIEKNPHRKDEGYHMSVVEALSENDKLYAIVMAMDMLFAGVDTTTTTLTGILLGLAKNPDAQDKLRQEARKILPDKDSVLTVESMKNLPYVRACIKEGIRMYPIGPGTARTMPKDIVLNGYQIPEGTNIAMGNNVILREDKYYPRANEFIPERWLRTEEGAAYKSGEVNPFVYLPFGFGARSCAGKRIVEVDLELTLLKLVRNFNIEFNYSIENAFETIFFTRPAIPLKFKFTELED